MTTPRLTPEQAAAVDALAAKGSGDDPDMGWREYITVHERQIPRMTTEFSCRILDLLDRVQQLESDMALLAAEVQAWRRFDNQCSVRDQIVYTADSRPTHPADTMKATDSSGALTRATPAEGGDA